MKITNVTATNFKNQTFNTDLAPVTVITGNSFAGKSSRLEAIELALRGTFTGKTPGSKLGNKEIMERFASGLRYMSVHIETGSNQAITRTWQRDSKDGVSRRDGWVGFEVDYAAPSLMFDHGEFLNLSDKERTKFLFRVLPPPPLDKVGPDAIKTNLKNWKANPHTELHEKRIGEECRIIDAAFAARMQTGQTIQSWLEATVEDVRENKNAAVATARRMKETILGVEQLKAPDAASLAAAERAVSTTRQALEAAQAEATRISTQKNECAKEWVKHKAAVDAAGGLSLHDLQSVLGAHMQARPVIPDTVDLQSFVTAHNQAERAWSDAVTVTNVSHAAMTKLQSELDELDKTKTCAKCGQSLAKLKAKVKANLEEQLSAVTAQKAHDKEIENEFKRRRDQTEDRMKAAVTADNAYRQAIMSKGNWEAAKADIERRIAAAETVDSHRAELQRIEVRGNDLKNELAAAENDAARKLAECQTAMEKHREALAAAAAARTQEQSRAKADEATAEADVLKALADILADLLELCVSESLKPFLTSVNELVGDILPARMGFVDGQIGLLRNGGLTPWASCSDGEQLLMSCALRVGLATEAPLKLLTIGRFESLDSSLQSRFITRCLELIGRGKIDQALFINVGTFALRPSGHGPVWSVVDV